MRGEAEGVASQHYSKGDDTTKVALSSEHLLPKFRGPNALISTALAIDGLLLLTN